MSVMKDMQKNWLHRCGLRYDRGQVSTCFYFFALILFAIDLSIFVSLPAYFDFSPTVLLQTCLKLNAESFKLQIHFS